MVLGFSNKYRMQMERRSKEPHTRNRVVAPRAYGKARNHRTPGAQAGWFLFFRSSTRVSFWKGGFLFRHLHCTAKKNLDWRGLSHNSLLNSIHQSIFKKIVIGERWKIILNVLRLFYRAHIIHCAI